MKELVVVPLVNVGEIFFGMDRAEVRNIWGECEEFSKVSDGYNDTDDFGFCHVFYDQSDRCEAIEIFEEVDVRINNKKVFPDEFKNIVDYLLTLDQELDYDEYECRSNLKSIGVYAPCGKAECILFGKKGYYSSFY